MEEMKEWVGWVIENEDIISKLQDNLIFYDQI